MEKLTPEQRLVLDQFRKNTYNLQLPESGDRYLLRWLRARLFDIEKSEEMLRNHIEWRRTWGVDELKDDWEPPKVFKKYSPMGFIGFDKEGRPVWFGRHAQFDIRGALMSVNSRDYLRYNIWILERSRRMMVRQSEALKKDVTSHIIISDMEGYKLKNMTYKPGMDLGLKFAQMYEANYPEMLEKAIILNTAQIFHGLFKILKPLLSEHTLSKMELIGSNRAEWETMLKEMIPLDVLPKKWGGKKVDSTGDDACSKIIGKPGDIPKKYYLSNRQAEQSLNLEDCLVIRIVNGKKFILDKTISKPNSIIRWKFRSEGGDIGFGIQKAQPSGGKALEVLAKTRVMAHQYIEEGLIVADAGDYFIEFDNSYSYLTPKIVTFCVEIADIEDASTSLERVE